MLEPLALPGVAFLLEPLALDGPGVAFLLELERCTAFPAVEPVTDELVMSLRDLLKGVTVEPPKEAREAAVEAGPGAS